MLAFFQPRRKQTLSPINLVEQNFSVNDGKSPYDRQHHLERKKMESCGFLFSFWYSGFSACFFSGLHIPLSTNLSRQNPSRTPQLKGGE